MKLLPLPCGKKPAFLPLLPVYVAASSFLLEATPVLT